MEEGHTTRLRAHPLTLRVTGEGIEPSARQDRAVCHALGLGSGDRPDVIPVGIYTIPVGIYTIPELASVGLSESEARARLGGVVIGRADFAELARGQIAANEDGLLKLVADAAGAKILGVQIVGEGATELVHVGQMAMAGGLGVDAFIACVMNVPTLAEAYRVAAMDIVRQRAANGGMRATG